MYAGATVSLLLVALGIYKATAQTTEDKAAQEAVFAGRGPKRSNSPSKKDKKKKSSKEKKEKAQKL